MAVVWVIVTDVGLDATNSASPRTRCPAPIPGRWCCRWSQKHGRPVAHSRGTRLQSSVGGGTRTSFLILLASLRTCLRQTVYLSLGGRDGTYLFDQRTPVGKSPLQRPLRQNCISRAQASSSRFPRLAAMRLLLSFQGQPCPLTHFRLLNGWSRQRCST